MVVLTRRISVRQFPGGPRRAIQQISNGKHLQVSPGTGIICCCRRSNRARQARRLASVAEECLEDGTRSRVENLRFQKTRPKILTMDFEVRYTDKVRSERGHNR